MKDLLASLQELSRLNSELTRNRSSADLQYLITDAEKSLAQLSDQSNDANLTANTVPLANKLTNKIAVYKAAIPKALAIEAKITKTSARIKQWMNLKTAAGHDVTKDFTTGQYKAYKYLWQKYLQEQVYSSNRPRIIEVRAMQLIDSVLASKTWTNLT